MQQQPKNLPSKLHPILLRFRELWAELKGDREMPDADDSILSKFTDFQNNLCLIDVEEASNASRRFRYRMVGRTLTEIIGADVTGRYLDEIYGDDAYDWLSNEYEEAIASRAPSYHSFLRNTVDNALIFYERLLLPLGQEGKAPSAFIALHLTTIKGAASNTDVDCPLPVKLI